MRHENIYEDDEEETKPLKVGQKVYFSDNEDIEYMGSLAEAKEDARDVIYELKVVAIYKRNNWIKVK